jgi:hypothetical protein
MKNQEFDGILKKLTAAMLDFEKKHQMQQNP